MCTTCMVSTITWQLPRGSLSAPSIRLDHLSYRELSSLEPKELAQFGLVIFFFGLSFFEILRRRDALLPMQSAC